MTKDELIARLKTDLSNMLYWAAVSDEHLTFGGRDLALDIAKARESFAMKAEGEKA